MVVEGGTNSLHPHLLLVMPLNNSCLPLCILIMDEKGSCLIEVTYIGSKLSFSLCGPLGNEPYEAKGDYSE